MNMSSINDILQMRDGDPIHFFTGTLINLWDPKTGTTNTGKPYSFQNGKVKDHTGMEMRIVFKDRDTLPQSMRGNQITVASRQGEHGWTGVKCQDNNYNGKMEKQIYVTPSATITQGAGAPVQGSPQTQAYANSAPPPQAYQPPTNRASSPQPNIPMTKRRLMQFANLYITCRQAINAAFEASGQEFGPEDISEGAQRIYFDAVKEGLADSMPSGKLGSSSAPAPAPAPAPPPPPPPAPAPLPPSQQSEPPFDPENDDVPF